MLASGWTLLLTGAVWLLFSYNAIRPHYTRAVMAAASFFAGWLRAELALPALLLEVPLFGVLIWNGALRCWPGGIGLVLHAISIVLLLVSLHRSFISGSVVDAALAGFADDQAVPMKLPWRLLLVPFLMRHPAVEKLKNRVYHRDDDVTLELDVYRRRAGGDGRRAARQPALVFVHGGAWMIGFKKFQGLPMLQHFAALGWVCFSINYRLSPRATFPDHVVDVKRAIAWVRAHADEYGCDPDFIVVCGNSAGGHLASLTPNEPSLQPGFADADTSTAACLSFYGVYDFSDRFSHWHNRGLQALLEKYVMKARLSEAPERFEAASPLAHVGAHAPPLLVVHGDRDSIVPVAEARAFVAALRGSTAAPCVYIEVPGAQHAFEVFPSVRTVHLLRGLQRFATHVHRQYLAGAGAAVPQ
jgi:acetyl esterase/lipase